MKIEFNRNPNLKAFDELRVGQTYFTKDGDLCIKTSYSTTQGDENCIYFSTVCENWQAYHEDKTTIVEVVDSILNVNAVARCNNI